VKGGEKRKGSEGGNISEQYALVATAALIARNKMKILQARERCCSQNSRRCERVHDTACRQFMAALVECDALVSVFQGNLRHLLHLARHGGRKEERLSRMLGWDAAQNIPDTWLEAANDGIP